MTLEEQIKELKKHLPKMTSIQVLANEGKTMQSWHDDCGVLMFNIADLLPKLIEAYENEQAESRKLRKMYHNLQRLLHYGQEGCLAEKYEKVVEALATTIDRAAYHKELVPLRDFCIQTLEELGES